MKVLSLCHSDTQGGAARAAYRIHSALREAGEACTFVADDSTSGHWTVEAPRTAMAKTCTRIRPHLGGLVAGMLRTANPIIHSPAILPSGRLQTLNESEADILHLHWVQGEMLSIADIGRLRKPVVWTLHDMWAFCGAEHVAWDERWKEGYSRKNRPSHESGFDLNRWTWERKRKHWRRPLHIVTPSRWLAECVRDSALMRDWPVSVVPNCIDTERWYPVDRNFARALIGVPADVPLLLFGTAGANSAHHKGFDLLAGALNCLRGEMPELELVVFGETAPRDPPNFGFRVHYVGHLHDDISLRALYSAADALVVPSRVDNLPNTGVESMACGTPVVAFNTCGLTDIVDHQCSGYLATPFDEEDLARGIQWVVGCTDRLKELRDCARRNAVLRFSNPVIASLYIQLYRSLV